MIEFFSGTRTVSKFFKSKGWAIDSLDINPKLSPSICCNILDFDFHSLPGSVNFFWFSPDCTKLSRAGMSSSWTKKTIKYRIYDYIPNDAASMLSVQLVTRCVEICQAFPKVPFIIENPIGRIQHLAPMKKLGHFRYFVNYASFGHPFSKETYLFSNIMLPLPVKKYKVNAPGLRTVRNVTTRSEVPIGLIKYLYPYIQSI